MLQESHKFVHLTKRRLIVPYLALLAWAHVENQASNAISPLQVPFLRHADTLIIVHMHHQTNACVHLLSFGILFAKKKTLPQSMLECNEKPYQTTGVSGRVTTWCYSATSPLFKKMFIATDSTPASNSGVPSGGARPKLSQIQACWLTENAQTCIPSCQTK